MQPRPESKAEPATTPQVPVAPPPAEPKPTPKPVDQQPKTESQKPLAPSIPKPTHNSPHQPIGVISLTILAMMTLSLLAVMIYVQSNG